MKKFYRKLPVTIEAIQYDGTNKPEIFAFCPKARNLKPRPAKHFVIDTDEGAMTVNVGDWVIKGIKGEFYPCKPDVFALTYEEVDAS